MDLFRLAYQLFNIPAVSQFVRQTLHEARCWIQPEARACAVIHQTPQQLLESIIGQHRSVPVGCYLQQIQIPNRNGESMRRHPSPGQLENMTPQQIDRMLREMLNRNGASNPNGERIDMRNRNLLYTR
ncbi:MAG: hypothetical protein U1F57_10535 [bacterium]